MVLLSHQEQELQDFLLSQVPHTLTLTSSLLLAVFVASLSSDAKLIAHMQPV